MLQYSMRIGFTAGAFDLLHAGHILMLKEAYEQCDHLIVGLHTDPSIDRPTTKTKPIQSIVERHIQLKAVRYVDEIIVYETEKDLENILKSHKIDVRTIGADYNDTDFTGKKICKDRGIKIHYNQRDHGYSTTELRQRIADGVSAFDLLTPA